MKYLAAAINACAGLVWVAIYFRNGSVLFAVCALLYFVAGGLMLMIRDVEETNEGYPGIAHDFETLKKQNAFLVFALGEVKVSVGHGDAKEIARAALAKVRP